MSYAKKDFEALFDAESRFIEEVRGAAAEQQSRSEDVDDGEEVVISRGPAPTFSGCRAAGATGRDLKTPWVITDGPDRVGMALSGGGIRSATYNLGLLQGLSELGVLKRIDYLTTVSGGGYIGSWLTAWLHRSADASALPFPPISKDVDRFAEPDAVRHVRDFSNYLVPRFGVFEVEFWNALANVMNGMVPAICVAVSLMSTVAWAYLVLAWGALSTGALMSTAVVVGSAALVLVLAEIWWRYDLKRNDNHPGIPSLSRYIWFSAFALIGVATLWLLSIHFAYWLQLPPQANSPPAFFIGLPWGNWSRLVALFWPGLIALAVMVLLIFIDFSGLLGRRSEYATGIGDLSLQRVQGRLGFIVLMWIVPAAIWCVAVYIRHRTNLIVSTGGIGGLAAALFSYLRSWLVRNLQPGRRPGFGKLLRALIPQVLAYLALVAALILVCIGIQYSFSNTLASALTAAVPLFVIVGALVWLDPVNCGLHAFYRDRLCRAYLGASNPNLTSQQSNALTDSHPDDDLRLQGLVAKEEALAAEGPLRLPLHLVCCAANELDADPLSNLSRGARSAVLSRLGLSIDDSWGETGDITLGAAMTASAAAFNSNMGSVSKQLGWGVQFLMCALNLRLGLWVARPGQKPFAPRLKGLPYFLEMWGSTRDRAVHLSDGGHFENLALYELVRRHCRYIILSDVGADPEVAFEDFGNAVRRIREDFGVNIEVDLAPLKPNAEGCVSQHMVVGTIHYDAARTDGASDKGILLYFKPGLTGDEPADVLQYKSRNDAFPNETTVDQFYDEAQWEAYRCLGHHAAHAALDFINDLTPAVGQRTSPPNMFVQARWRWYPTPPELPDTMLVLTDRYIKFEDTLRATAPKQMIADIYPELGLRRDEPWQQQDIVEAVHVLIKLIQIMEDTFYGCKMKGHWNHPLNNGWMNTFRRWAATPIFQYWWPILKAMYSDRFREFVEGRLGLEGRKAQMSPPESFDSWAAVPAGLAKDAASHDRFAIQATAARATTTFRAGTYRLPSVGVLPELDLQACLLRFDVLQENGAEIWSWGLDDLFVLPQLRDIGIGSQFMTQWMHALKNTKNRPFELRVGPPERFTIVELTADPALRAEWSDHLLLYKRLGFQEEDGKYIYRWK